LGDEPLTADADVDARLLERVDDRDVRVGAVVALSVRLVRHHDVGVGRAVVEHDHEVAMLRRHAVLAERVHVGRNRRQHRVQTIAGIRSRSSRWSTEDPFSVTRSPSATAS